MVNNITYRFDLGGDRLLSYIGFCKTHIYLRKVNKREAGCKNCQARIQSGQGVWYGDYGGSGFVHIDCARQIIIARGSMGYRIDILSNLQAGIDQAGEFPADYVARSITKYGFTTNDEGIDILNRPTDLPRTDQPMGSDLGAAADIVTE